MAETFLELGIPFPLFEGRVEDAKHYFGPGVCYACGDEAPHCFAIEQGSAVVDCPNCHHTTAVADGGQWQDACCSSCGEAIGMVLHQRKRLWGLLGSEQLALVCYTCLRAGKAALSKDTVFGVIGWKEAVDGVTFGVPDPGRDDFEIVSRDLGDFGARLPQEDMHELLRTPSYHTIQDIEQWQFCCRKPMVYAGVWSQEDFSRHAPDGDGQKLFADVVADAVPGLWEDASPDVVGVYVFRCSQCAW